MPEGDSIAKLARRLRPALVGRAITRLFLRERGDVPSLVGTRVASIDTLGKNLLLRLGDDWVVRVHLGMNGRFRTWAPRGDEHARRHSASLVVCAEGVVAMCTNAMTAELRRARDLQLERSLRRLGPDLLAASCSLDDVVARALAPEHADRPLADLLLDQRVAAGIGNVYKSEVAFVVGVHPRARAGTLEPATVRELYETARSMLQANMVPGMRTTTVSRVAGIRRPPSLARHWVYRRRGLPCLRCRTTIERALVGDGARSTYWCPTCQPEHG